MLAYKVLTHDLRPPIHGGEPVFDGTCPYELPLVAVDTSDNDCGAGHNACRKLSTALRIAGLWPNGRTSTAWVVEHPVDMVERGDKLRAARWTITRQCTDAEVAAAVREMSEPFGELAYEMAHEQLAWRHALMRPECDEDAVADGLRVALAARGLDWTLRRFKSKCAAWDDLDDLDDWDVWRARSYRPARDAWASSWAAKYAWADRASDWDYWYVRSAWVAKCAKCAKCAKYASDAKDASDALTVYYAARRRWVNMPPNKLTAGLREAYQHGLAIAIPSTDTRELWWSV